MVGSCISEWREPGGVAGAYLQRSPFEDHHTVGEDRHGALLLSKCIAGKEQLDQSRGVSLVVSFESPNTLGSGMCASLYSSVFACLYSYSVFNSPFDLV